MLLPIPFTIAFSRYLPSFAWMPAYLPLDIADGGVMPRRGFECSSERDLGTDLVDGIGGWTWHRG